MSFHNSTLSLRFTPEPNIESTHQRAARRRPHHHRARSVYTIPPNVLPRGSSLYLPTESTDPIKDIPLALPNRKEFPDNTFTTPAVVQDYGYFDTRAHTDIWDELFVSAYQTTKTRSEGYQLSSSAFSFGQTMSADSSDEESVRAIKPEIHIKVNFLISFLSLTACKPPAQSA